MLQNLLEQRSKEHNMPSGRGGGTGGRLRRMSSEKLQSRQSVFDSSRSIMRLSRISDPTAESGEQSNLGLDEGNERGASISQEHAMAPSSGSHDSSRFSHTVPQDLDAHNQDVPNPQRKAGSLLKEELPEPDLQPSPFADVSNSSQLWPALPLLDHAMLAASPINTTPNLSSSFDGDKTQ